MGKHGFTAVQRDALACSMLHGMVLFDSHALAAQGKRATPLVGRHVRRASRAARRRLAEGRRLYWRCSCSREACLRVYELLCW